MIEKDSSKRSRLRRRRRALTRAHRWVVYFSILVLFLGLGNLARAGVVVNLATHLSGPSTTVSWEYQALSGVFWGAAFVTCMVGLARFRPWGRWATLGAVTLYEAHGWIDRFLAEANARAMQHRPWDLVWTLVLLAITWGFLNLPRVRAVFRPASASGDGGE